MVMRGGGTTNTPQKYFLCIFGCFRQYKNINKIRYGKVCWTPHAYGNSIVFFKDFYLYPSLNK